MFGQIKTTHWCRITVEEEQVFSHLILCRKISVIFCFLLADRTHFITPRIDNGPYSCGSVGVVLLLKKASPFSIYGPSLVYIYIHRNYTELSSVRFFYIFCCTSFAIFTSKAHLSGPKCKAFLEIVHTRTRIRTEPCGQLCNSTCYPPTETRQKTFAQKRGRLIRIDRPKGNVTEWK